MEGHDEDDAAFAAVAGQHEEGESSPQLAASGMSRLAVSEGEEGSASFLPPFANEANKKASNQIQKLERLLEDAEAGLEENEDRVGVMDEHLQNVQTELTYTQARVTSKAKEMKSEEHMMALCERESARITADMRQLNKERDRLLDTVGGLQNNIYRAQEKMDQFRVLMNWNQEELEQWAVTQQQKEEDNEAVEKYRLQDDTKIKELNIAVERMNRDVFGKKAGLEREVTETQAAQIQLDKAADDFAALHKGRQELIRQWDDAMEQMRRNDEAIQHATGLFASKKGELRKLQDKLDASAKFLDNELMNNKERDAQIELLERDVGRLREVYSAEQGRTTELSDQVELLKSTLGKAANDCASKQAHNEALKEELDRKRNRLDDLRTKLTANRRKLEGEYAQLDSLEAKEAELENLRRAEEQHNLEVEKEIKELEKVQYRQAQALSKERMREKDLISEISGGQGQNRNMVAKIQQLDDQVVRQQELLYNVEFQLQQMERKVARAKGERSDEETRTLNEKIDALSQVLEGVNAQHGMLLGQVKKAEDDLGHATVANQNLNKEKGKIEGEMAALTLETDQIARSLKAATANKQQRLMEQDMRKLEVQRLRSLLNTKADEVFTLENQKFQLQQSLHERRLEIDVHKRSLQAELKLLKDDLHRVTLEQAERKQKVDRLEARFGVMSKKNKSIYDDDEPRSQAYYVIKAAQEREELQSCGDGLDVDIRRMEKEAGALERTLQEMVGANQGLSKSFKPVSERVAFDERAKLRAQLDKTYDRLKFKRGEERAIAGDIQQADGRLTMLADEKASLQNAVQALEQRRDEANAAVQDQAVKLERAEARVQRLRESGETSTVQDIQVAMLREGTLSMMQELSKLNSENPSAGIAAAMEAAGIKLPAYSGFGSRGVSRSGSGFSRPASAASLSRGISGPPPGSAGRTINVS